ncbi:MAG: enoyl-CoA hydratase-related protein, partial [Alphaproteobacteria bacterium]
YAADIVANAPLTIKTAKAAIDAIAKDPADRDLAKIEAMTKACFDSADYAEGRKAFMEKRKPVFTGR